MYKPPHQRNERKVFRNEFPELCPKSQGPAPLSFSHIKNIVHVEPIQVIPVKEPPKEEFSEKQVIEAIETMVQRWEKNEHYQNYIEKYPIVYSDESEESEEISSLEAEDPDYESDF